MNEVDNQQVKEFLLGRLADSLTALGVDPRALPDDFDLLSEGVIDSLGILEMIAAMEQHFGVELDYEELDPENLTILGPFCRFVEESCRRKNADFHDVRTDS